MATPVCPYLGLSDDSATRYTFASEANCCHRARPVEAVREEFQLSHCLTRNYTTCPVFISGREHPLPADIQAYPDEIKKM